MLWTFSIYLEAVAILPQLVRRGLAVRSLLCLLSCGDGAQVMLQNSGNVDNLTGHYVFFLGFVCALSAAPF